jgi:signal transduction histidine kinase
MLSLALLVYALGQSLASAYPLIFFPHRRPFPWWTDLLFLLEYLFFFLALAFWPGFSQPSRLRFLRWKVMFDSLLLMGAATALSWYFLLAPFYLRSRESTLGKGVNIAFAAGDLGLLFGLILALLPRHAHRGEAERVALVILTLAVVLLILGDTWYAWLNLFQRYTPAAPPALFWLVASLLAPLAGLMRLRLMQHRPPSQREQTLATRARLPEREDYLNEAGRVLLPLIVALLACAAIAVRAIIEPVRPMNPLIPILVIFGLLLLVLVRQGITVLENAQWHRRWALSLAHEQALREVNRQMEAFLGIAGHELKTPLTTLILSLQLLQRYAQPQGPRPRAGAGRARREISLYDLELPLQQAERLNRLVSELLDTSRIRAGQLQLNLEPADLAAIVQGVVREQCQAAPERSITLTLPDESVPVLADADRIEQVVTNYLTNAIKYSPEDRPVEVGLQVEEEQARVWVQDQGPGIPLAEQERLWERFHRVPGIAVQSGSGIGLGLGLYISKTIITSHQGQVGVQSTPGQGATFWFTLPLAVAGPNREAIRALPSDAGVSEQHHC